MAKKTPQALEFPPTFTPVLPTSVNVKATQAAAGLSAGSPPSRIMSKAQALAQHKAKPAAERNSGDGKLRGVPVDLETAVANLHVSPDVIIRVEDVPSDARLSAGDATSGLVTGEEGQDKMSVWSLKVADLPDLHLLTSSPEPINYPLTIRVLMPDPDGYAYASTVAKFDILVTDAGGVS